MKKQLILIFFSVLCFSLFGQNQDLENKFELKTDTNPLTVEWDKDIEYLNMPLPLNASLNGSTLLYKGDSEVRLTQSDYKLPFFLDKILFK